MAKSKPKKPSPKKKLKKTLKKTPTSLADCMRAGAKIRPQCHGEFYKGTPDGTVHSCAVGAAIEGKLGKLDLPYGLYGLFPEFKNEAKCPVSGCRPPIRFVYGAIIHLNDKHNWTREQIADWLDRNKKQHTN